MKKISMKDIARELKTSITTVSFVINGKSEEMGISPETTKKVRDLIKKRGFNPNSAARILRTGKSKTIGLMVEDIGNYFFGNIAKVIEREAHKSGYNVFYCSTENNDDTAKELIQKMKNSSVDGYIITATSGLKDDIIRLRDENIPVVLIDRLIPNVDTNYVILDNYVGSYDLTTHLITNGYCNIGLVTIFSEMSMMGEREKGYIKALTDTGMGYDPGNTLKVHFEDTEVNIIKAIKKYITQHPQLDAIFFTTNYLGVMGIEALQKCNLIIPGDMAIVSFDDNDLFRLLTPSITVAAQPIKEIATQSIDLLLKVIKKEHKQSKTVGIVIKPEIIVRESSPVKKKRKVVSKTRSVNNL
jgi:LacI family transcriptional regulator